MAGQADGFGAAAEAFDLLLCAVEVGVLDEVEQVPHGGACHVAQVQGGHSGRVPSVGMGGRGYVRAVLPVVAGVRVAGAVEEGIQAQGGAGGEIRGDFRDTGGVGVGDVRGADAGEAGAALHRHHRDTDIGGVLQGDRAGVGPVADVVAERGHRGFHRLLRERQPDRAHVADERRDSVARGLLADQDGQDADAAALLDQVLHQPGVLRRQRGQTFRLGVAALVLAEERVLIIDEHHGERPQPRGADVPHVLHAQQGPNHRRPPPTQRHQTFEQCVGLIQVVTAEREHPLDQVRVVALRGPRHLPVEAHDLHGRRRREVADELVDRRGLARTRKEYRKAARVAATAVGTAHRNLSRHWSVFGPVTAALKALEDSMVIGDARAVVRKADEEEALSPRGVEAPGQAKHERREPLHPRRRAGPHPHRGPVGSDGRTDPGPGRRPRVAQAPELGHREPCRRS